MLKREKLSVDLCVIGGGMAGISAAIAAAREGVRVALVHERPVLGGNASSEIRMWICGAQGENDRETGILEEIFLENLHKNPSKNYYVWDALLYDFVKREKNITLLLNTTCMDAAIEKGNFANGRSTRITSVTAYCLTTQSFWEIEAPLFTDCSGDSILAPLTGAKYRLGRESKDEFGEDTSVVTPDKMVMGMSCILAGRETDRSVRFVAPDFAKKLTDEDVTNRPMNPRKTVENYWYLELGGESDTIAETENIKEELIALALGAWDYIKNSGKYDTENWELDFLGFLPGKRESRRMVGEYLVTQRDITDNVIFPDTVAYGGWPLDDHYPAGYYHKGSPNKSPQSTSPYCLPYRALYSANVENLFFAGRNISVTHTAMSSIRVMATCSLLGQAVGTAAAVALAHGTTPHGVYLSHMEELQNRLLHADCFLPYRTRPISALCRKTELLGGCDALKNGEDRPHRTYGTAETGMDVENGKRIEYRFDEPTRLSSIHIVFDSDLGRVTVPGDRIERTHAMRCNVLLDSPMMHLPTTLCRDFRIELCGDKDETIEVTDNQKRCYDIKLSGAYRAIRLTPLSNWGESDKTRIFSFDFE